ncbi:hypothetical protein BN1221_03434 [Brenneria goodwinii]|uniref:Uncharacterized protein n=1 Tax=Brenneria goodwinii TaxID=1109412 RepID=A0A0G4JZ01_9GAMM|nr:hypothetical protein BN1221_03434 [Brenneria goodwinii]
MVVPASLATEQIACTWAVWLIFQGMSQTVSIGELPRGITR